LWLRRIVRRAWIAIAIIVVAEAALWMVARIVPIGSAPLVAAAIPVVVALGLLAATVKARPSLGETALAVDAEGGLGDRVSSALELAVAAPESARPADPASQGAITGDEAAEFDRFVRRQRTDALAALRRTPPLFRPRWSRAPMIAIAIAAVVLVPALALPNPQDAVIAQHRDIVDAAVRQADRLERLADDLQERGAETDDPRTELAEALRELARRVRDEPGDLAANLRSLSALENEVRARIDPATEQRAAAMTSLARSLSRTATGDPEANRDGDRGRCGRISRVVDDVEDIIATYKSLLEIYGYEVEIAASAGEAEAAFRAFQPDVALLDIGMPDMDGYDLCRLLQALPGGNGCVFYSQSGWGKERDFERSREAGFRELLVSTGDSVTRIRSSSTQ
jgi:CheY-like chemotaxis protein